MRPIESLVRLVNHTPPSGPAVIPCGPDTVGAVKLVTTPVGVTWPMVLVVSLANHRLPSGPATMPRGPWMLASVYAVTTPVGVTLPTPSTGACGSTPDE
jgi:hypothetical protein